MSKKKAERKLAETEAMAVLRNLRTSPRKLNLVAQSIRGQEVGRALAVRAIFAERQDGRLMLRRGFALEPGEKVLVVEDVVTTGGSTRETIEVARAAGAVVVGAAAIIDRSGGQQPVAGGLQASGSGLDVPFYALAEVSLPTYAPESCPLCLAGLPVVKPGSRS